MPLPGGHNPSLGPNPLNLGKNIAMGSNHTMVPNPIISAMGPTPIMSQPPTMGQNFSMVQNPLLGQNPTYDKKLAMTQHPTMGKPSILVQAFV